MRADEEPRAKRPNQFVPPAPPKTPKAAGTRRLLLETAARLFVERGYTAVGMRNIATAVGLTKGAIYGHFRTKGQLLVEVIRWKLANREHSPEFLELTDDRERAVVLMFDRQGRDIRLLEVDAAAAARHDPDVAVGLADLYRERQVQIRAAISDVHDPEAVAWFISALSAGIAMNQAAARPLPDAEQLRNTVLTSLRALM